MDSLFGEGTSTPVKFFVAFVVVFALIAITAWLIRRFGSGPLGGQSTRGRAPRLAVIEAGAVDGRRKLVLIRRDNIEHLIMIGGPTDIVVEANIVRGQSSRDSAAQRGTPAPEALPRALPLGDEGAWPLQPEPAPRPAAARQRPAPLEDATQWALQPEQTPPVPAPKRSRSAETLAGLAAELSVRPAEPTLPMPAPAPRPAPAVEAPRAAKPAAAASPAADQNLADMAQRLEAALRRPAPAPAAPAARPAAPAVAPKPAAEAPRVTPPAAAQPAPKPADQTPAVNAAPEKQPEAPAPAPAKSDKPEDVFGSLEEEMANLLGRPSGKPS